MIEIICKENKDSEVCTQVLLDISIEDIQDCFPDYYKDWLVSGLKKNCREAFKRGNLDSFLQGLDKNMIEVNKELPTPITSLKRKTETFLKLLNSKGINVEQFIKETTMTLTI